MSSPFLWIFLPLIGSAILLLGKRFKVIALVVILLSFFLTLAAWLLPVGESLHLGSLSIRLGTTFTFFGRSFVLTSSDKSWLALFYGSFTIWAVVTSVISSSRRLLPLGLAITSILVAALAVKPFLYAALIIEVAVLLAIPFLSVEGRKPGKGLIRFLIFQTLAMPFILFSGWMLAGIEANPGDLHLVQQAAILIGLGFAFLLAIVPFHSWIPLLTEESSPLPAAFVLWFFPTVTLLFGLGFLDQYPWLRESTTLITILSLVGSLMVVAGGVLSLFQGHLGRIMGYAVVMETGFSLLSLTVKTSFGLSVFFLLLTPRILGWLLWAFSLEIIKKQHPSLELTDLKNLAGSLPMAAVGVVLANLSFVGLPLLAGFPPHQAVWSGLASTPGSLFWLLAGGFCLFIAAARTILVLGSTDPVAAWESRETPLQRILLSVGFLAILLLGLFPQWALPLWEKLPAVFNHLGQ